MWWTVTVQGADQCSLEGLVLCSLPQQTFQKFNTPLEICRTLWFIQVGWPQNLMMGWTVVLGKIISPIFISRCPMCFELSLFCSVLEPTKLHISCFASLLLDGSIWNCISSAVGCLHGSNSKLSMSATFPMLLSQVLLAGQS